MNETQSIVIQALEECRVEMAKFDNKLRDGVPAAKIRLIDQALYAIKEDIKNGVW